MSRDDEAHAYLRAMEAAQRQPRVGEREAAALGETMWRGRWASDLVANGAVAEGDGQAHAVAARGEAARKRLIEGNQRLVVSVADDYRDRGVPFAEIVEAGTAGLERAVEEFDWRRAPEFPGYAAAHIREAITKAVDGRD
jgi:DNA-directed RNA polymerase sigma subunit (sigma70/sigma32)